MNLSRGAVSSGVFFILLGATLLLDALEVWDVSGAILLPAVLVIAGLSVLAGAAAGAGRG